MARTPALSAEAAGAHRKGEIDPSFVITHRASLKQGPKLYKKGDSAELLSSVIVGKLAFRSSRF
jgi:threonine dehydrogenase-like Zn-dependent dehydrogenase